MDYRIDFGNLLTPYPQANPTGAVAAAAGTGLGLGHLNEGKREFNINKAQQDYQFGETQGLANRQQAAREYEDVQDRQAKEEAIKQKAFEAFSAHYAHDPEKASQVWGPILDHLGIDYHPPEQQESDLLKQDTEIRGGAPTDEAVPDSPGAPQASPSASTPDTPQPTSQTTGERAPMTAGQKQIASGIDDGVQKTLAGLGGETQAQQKLGQQIDEAVKRTLTGLRPGEDAASYIARNPPKDESNDRTMPDGPPYQTRPGADVMGALRPRKPPATNPAQTAAAGAAEARRIAQTPEPQPDESVQPPEEIAAGMKGPMTPPEWEAQGRPQPVVTPPAPVNPAAGPTLMDRKTGRVFAHMPPGNPHDVEQTRLLGAANGFLNGLSQLDPRVQTWAENMLREGIKRGDIRDHADLVEAQHQIEAQIRVMVNAQAAAHRGGGRDPTLSFDSGASRGEKEMTALRVPEAEDMLRTADKAQEMLAKGDINSVNAVKYMIARLNDPKGIVTTGDFENAASRTLIEKFKDFFMGNGPEPTLTPEEIGRMGSVIAELQQKARQRLLEARSALESHVGEAPAGEYRRGYQHVIGLHKTSTKPTEGGGAHTSVKDGPPL